ncbi:MAG: KH domain-containing protein [Nanoarchaeota archaeon]
MADDEVEESYSETKGDDAIQYSYTIKIPRDRIAIVIGKDGVKKKELENELKTRIQVDSKEGDITISGKDSLKIYIVKEIIKAMGRGFNPDVALLLLRQDYMLELINIMDFAKNKNHIPRLKGRIIGTKGKSRRTIETLTETWICVYGKTIGIIGYPDHVGVCNRAIEALLSGSPHSSVYKFLEKNKKEMKKRELLLK